MRDRLIQSGGLQRDVSILADKKRPRIWAQMRGIYLGGGGCCGVSANEYSCAQMHMEPK